VSASLPEADRFIVTAYSLGDGHTPTHGITASGERVREGHTAACPPELPFGTRVHIEGLGERVCVDRGGAIEGNRLDVYMTRYEDAVQFGRQELGVVIFRE